MENQMLPIQGASKAKRIKWGAAQNPISWAYMKMLREQNKTRKVYDINPYIEVYQFRDNLYGLFNQNCDGAGDVWMYLIIGPQKAMLIDTAFGLGDSRALVNKLTGGMPLIVANTHLGPDHVLGNCRYDTVYCHDYDFQAIKEKCQPGAWDYLFDKDGKNIWLQFDKKDLPVYKNYELVAVKDGHKFNLGGDYEVELVWTGGHTAGHAMYMDKKGRNLFCGDDVCSDVTGCGPGPTAGRANGQYANLTTYRDNLAKLVKRFDEFDYLFPGHFMMNLENNVLSAILEALNSAIDNPQKYNYKIESVGGTGTTQVRMYKYIKGFSTIAYTEKGIYPPGKEKL